MQGWPSRSFQPVRVHSFDSPLNHLRCAFRTGSRDRLGCSRNGCWPRNDDCGIGVRHGVERTAKASSWCSCHLRCTVRLNYGFILSNWRVAQGRAIPVIAAIEHFRSDRGRYPNALNELCPSYLPSIPRAGFTLVGRRYGYTAERPQLYFPAMFHGIVAFDFPTHGWRTNE